MKKQRILYEIYGKYCMKYAEYLKLEKFSKKPEKKDFILFYINHIHFLCSYVIF